MFWGLTIEPGKHYTQTVENSFHVSMAAMDTRDLSSLKDQAKMTQVVVQHDKAEFLLCSLSVGGAFQQPLDLNFTEGEEVTFFTEGRDTVHLTGYLVREEPLDLEQDLTYLDELSSNDEEVSSSEGMASGEESPVECDTKRQVSRRMRIPKIRSAFRDDYYGRRKKTSSAGKILRRNRLRIQRIRRRRDRRNLVVGVDGGLIERGGRLYMPLQAERRFSQVGLLSQRVSTNTPDDVPSTSLSYRETLGRSGCGPIPPGDKSTKEVVELNSFPECSRGTAEVQTDVSGSLLPEAAAIPGGAMLYVKAIDRSDNDQGVEARGIGNPVAQEGAATARSLPRMTAGSRPRWQVTSQLSSTTDRSAVRTDQSTSRSELCKLTSRQLPDNRESTSNPTLILSKQIRGLKAVGVAPPRRSQPGSDGSQRVVFPSPAEVTEVDRVPVHHRSNQPITTVYEDCKDLSLTARPTPKSEGIPSHYQPEAGGSGGSGQQHVAGTSGGPVVAVPTSIIIASRLDQPVPQPSLPGATPPKALPAMDNAYWSYFSDETVTEPGTQTTSEGAVPLDDSIPVATDMTCLILDDLGADGVDMSNHKVRLARGYDVFITRHDLYHAEQASKNSWSIFVRRLLDVFFDSMTLAMGRASTYGDSDRTPLDQYIIGAFRVFFKTRFNINKRELMQAVGYYCRDVRYKLMQNFPQNTS